VSTPTRAAAPPAWQLWTALGLVYVVWGSTYLAIRYVVETMPPLLSAGVRYGLAALLLGGWLLVRRGPQAFRATRRQWLSASVVGLLLLTGGNGGVNLAEQRGLPSGLAALLVAAIPLYVVVLRVAARDRPSATTVVGVAIGFVGLAVLLLPGARPAGVAPLAAGIVLCASGLWAIGSFYASRTSLPADALATTTIEMAAGCVGLLLAGALRGEQVDLGQISTASWVGLGYLVVFGSVVAFTAYSWLLGVAPVSKVSTYAYVNPVVAVLLGAVVKGEAVTGTAVVGGAITLLAVAVVVTEDGRRRRAGGPLEVPADAPCPPPDRAEGGQAPTDRHGRERSSAT
jgi:drug/metabolite transporter (DMT)-like permease